MIVAIGIKNHDDFVKMVQDKLAKTDIPLKSDYVR